MVIGRLQTEIRTLKEALRQAYQPDSTRTNLALCFQAGPDLITIHKRKAIGRLTQSRSDQIRVNQGMLKKFKSSFSGGEMLNFFSYRIGSYTFEQSVDWLAVQIFQRVSLSQFHCCSARESSVEMGPPGSVEEAFIESQVEGFIQQGNTDGLLQLFGNRQAIAIAFQVLRRLLLAAQSNAQAASSREDANAASHQISLLRKQARF
jgi:hypothetical protein